MPSFTHKEGAVFWQGEPIDRIQVNALLSEFKGDAEAAFFASLKTFDFDAFDRAMAAHGELLSACSEANRWAEASA